MTISQHSEVFASFLGRSPDTVSGDDIRRFQFAQIEQDAQPPKMNAQASASRFFFTHHARPCRPCPSAGRTHYSRKLPRVLTAYQVARLIEAAPHKAALSSHDLSPGQVHLGTDRSGCSSASVAAFEFCIATWEPNSTCSRTALRNVSSRGMSALSKAAM